MSVSATTITGPPRLPAQWFVAGLGGIVLLGGAVALGAERWQNAALFLVGGLLGVSQEERCRMAHGYLQRQHGAYCALDRRRGLDGGGRAVAAGGGAALSLWPL